MSLFSPDTSLRRKVMCPYPHCTDSRPNGDAAIVWCDGCQRTSVRCPACNLLNRFHASHCVVCAHALGAPVGLDWPLGEVPLEFQWEMQLQGSHHLNLLAVEDHVLLHDPRTGRVARFTPGERRDTSHELMTCAPGKPAPIRIGRHLAWIAAEGLLILPLHALESARTTPAQRTLEQGGNDIQIATDGRLLAWAKGDRVSIYDPQVGATATAPIQGAGSARLEFLKPGRLAVIEAQQVSVLHVVRIPPTEFRLEFQAIHSEPRLEVAIGCSGDDLLLLSDGRLQRLLHRGGQTMRLPVETGETVRGLLRVETWGEDKVLLLNDSGWMVYDDISGQVRTDEQRRPDFVLSPRPVILRDHLAAVRLERANAGSLVEIFSVDRGRRKRFTPTIDSIHALALDTRRLYVLGIVNRNPALQCYDLSAVQPS